MNVSRHAVCRLCRKSFPASYYAEFVCPFCARKAVSAQVRKRLSSEQFFGASPAPFVGRFGYPIVNVGILSPGISGDEVAFYDAPEDWAARNLSVSEVVDYRAALVNSRSRASIRGNERIIGLGREVAMSSRPVDIEVSFSKRPLSMSFSNFTAPIGPSVDLKAARLASNPKVHPSVEKVYSDTDLKAAEAVSYLFGRGFEVNFISRILSVATLGLKSNRKLVPTRFSITATDDIVGKSLMSSVRNYRAFDEYEVYFGGYLGNYYAVILLPSVWAYELFEAYANGSDFSTDNETYFGRKSYAENCAGGYYAARLAVLEKLESVKRQASALLIRVISDEYLLPLGVWVCRESVRKALLSQPVRFASSELALRYVMALFKRKLGFDVQAMFSASKVLRDARQARLSSYF